MKQLPTVTKNPSKAQQYLNRAAVVATVATASVGAFADTASGGYDVTSVLTNLGLAVSAAGAIGVAWLGFSAGISIWKNLRAAAK